MEILSYYRRDFKEDFIGTSILTPAPCSGKMTAKNDMQEVYSLGRTADLI